MTEREEKRCVNVGDDYATTTDEVSMCTTMIANDAEDPKEICIQSIHMDSTIPGTEAVTPIEIPNNIGC